MVRSSGRTRTGHSVGCSAADGPGTSRTFETWRGVTDLERIGGPARQMGEIRSPDFNFEQDSRGIPVQRGAGGRRGAAEADGAAKGDRAAKGDGARAAGADRAGPRVTGRQRAT